jgi:hypothetical protein
MMDDIAFVYEKYILSEDIESIDKQCAKLLISAGYKENTLIEIKKITEPYLKDHHARNYAHLVPLTKFYIELKGNVELLKKEYSDYMKCTKLKVSKKISHSANFRDFSSAVHTAVSKSKIEELKKTPSKNEKFDDPIYSDEYIDVYLATDPNDIAKSSRNCIKYGQGIRYGLCISNPNNALVYYNQYRFDSKLTTYFIYFKDETKNLPANFIIIDADEDGGYSYNLINDNTDIETNANNIIRRFPELSEAFKQNIFKSIPITGEERKILHVINNCDSILALNKIIYKLAYISSGKIIRNNEWEKIPKNELEILLSSYIESYEHDIPYDILKQFPKLYTRYKQLLKKRITDKLEDYELFNGSNFTVDEMQYIISDSILYDQIIKPQETRSRMLEISIRKQSKNNIYKGNIHMDCMYVLPNLSDIEIDGDFRCSQNMLISLKGSPKRVRGLFDCSENMLEDLIGSPEEVNGNFNCSANRLITLEGSPKIINGDFNCSFNKITTLKDSPETINGAFYCFKNHLTDLKNCPEVGKNFNCGENRITSLNGAPSIINGDFRCSRNKLENLIGAPKEIRGGFYCMSNNLKSLDGIYDSTIDGIFDFGENPLKQTEETTPTLKRRNKSDEEIAKLKDKEIERKAINKSIDSIFEHKKNLPSFKKFFLY